MVSILTVTNFTDCRSDLPGSTLLQEITATTETNSSAGLIIKIFIILTKRYTQGETS